MYYEDVLQKLFWTGRSAEKFSTTFYEYKYYGSDRDIFTLEQFDSFEQVIKQCGSRKGMSEIKKMGPLIG